MERSIRIESPSSNRFRLTTDSSRWRAIGIDIGGTSARAALVDNGGNVIERRITPTPTACSPANFFRLLCGLVVNWRTRSPAAIGLATPGIVDQVSGTVVRSVNLPWLEGFSWRDQLARLTGLPCTQMTDADAATWGEYHRFRADCFRGIGEAEATSLPARIKAPAFLHLRIGTGVALGLVRHERIEPIEQARSGHLDLLIVDRTENAPACPCGKRGCLEAILSRPVLRRQLRNLGLDVGAASLNTNEPRASARAVAQPHSEPRSSYPAVIHPNPELRNPAREAIPLNMRCDNTNHDSTGAAAVLHDARSEGPPNAARILHRARDALITAIRNVAGAFPGATLCLGGGLLSSLPVLVDFQNVSRGTDDDRLMRGTNLTITRAALGDDAGVIGAALLAASSHAAVDCSGTSSTMA